MEDVWRSWFLEEGRLRAWWRIFLYFALLLVLFLVGAYAGSLLPRSPLGWVSYVVVTGAGLLAGWAVLVKFDRRPPAALGFAITPASGRELLAGLGLGGGLIAGACFLVLASGSARFVPDTGTISTYAVSLAWTFAFFWVAAMSEEVVFRGYVFQALVEWIGVWPTLILTSALFSLAHLSNPNLSGAEMYIALSNIFLAGILLGLAYLRTRSLWFATALHTSWNWTMASALGFPVSGITLVDTPLYDAVETGADWWTGGEFGPEAGLAATTALLLGVLWLVRTRRLAESPEMRAMRPIVDDRLVNAGW